jgi:hypothetical protein
MRDGGIFRAGFAQRNSSHGGRKAHLNFELKDLRPSQILDFEVQMRSGLPCDE